jgi:hypothetical protein
MEKQTNFMPIEHKVPVAEVLFIDRSTSQCGACRQQTLPRGNFHKKISGYGGGGPGCGAEWNYVSSNCIGSSEWDEQIAAMRPDLQWVDYRDIDFADREDLKMVHAVGIAIWIQLAGLNYEVELIAISPTECAVRIPKGSHGAKEFVEISKLVRMTSAHSANVTDLKENWWVQ